VLERFESRQQFVDAVMSRLPEQSLTADVRLAVAEAIADADAGMQRDSAERGGLELRVGNWFVRNDDLPFFETLGAIGPLVATLVATGGLAAPAVIGAVAALMGSAWKVSRKGGRLSREQMAALTVLETRGPLTVEELQAALAELGLSLENTKALLEGLKDVELSDGSGASLVRRSYDGTWRVAGV